MCAYVYVHVYTHTEHQNLCSKTSLWGTNRWAWEAARVDLKLQSNLNKKQVRLPKGAVSGVAISTALREKNAGGKYGTDKVCDL